MVTSILEDQQYIFGVRSLHNVEKVLLMKDILTVKSAISSQHLFSSGIHKLVGRWAKCLNKRGIL